MSGHQGSGSIAGRWSAIALATAGALGMLGSAGGRAAGAQSCPATVKTEQELRVLPALTAKPVPSLGRVLDTTFDVRMKTLCVPVESGTSWSSQPLALRTYVYPDPKTRRPTWGHLEDNVRWVSPGPTLLLEKPRTPAGQGDRLWVKLGNDLTTTTNQCASACPSTTPCPDSIGKLPPPDNCGTLCCCWADLQQKWPDCFHGNNVTNLHFHGTHVSPQAPQDYVLLELYPQPVAGARRPDVHAAHLGGEIAFGSYQYKVDPLLPTQPEGTHWYHPHKHGSVALQVANGMAGALQIEGPFDDQPGNFSQGNGGAGGKL